MPETAFVPDSKFCREERVIAKHFGDCPLTDWTRCQLYRKAIREKTQNLWRNGTKIKRYPDHSVEVMKASKYHWCGNCNKLIIPNEDYAILHKKEDFYHYNSKVCRFCLAIVPSRRVLGKQQLCHLLRQVGEGE